MGLASKNPPVGPNCDARYDAPVTRGTLATFDRLSSPRFPQPQQLGKGYAASFNRPFIVRNSGCPSPLGTYQDAPSVRPAPARGVTAGVRP